MARNVNVTYTNWRTGTNISIARRLVDVTVDYIDDAGTPQTRSGTVTFPDILNSLTAADLKDFAIEIMLRAYRRTQGVD